MLRSTAHLLAALLAGAALAGVLAPAALADVLIGVPGPVEGPHAATAGDITRAVKLAADEINAAGGIAGERLQIVEADDGCSAEHAEKAARALVARGVALVVGHPCANAAVAAARVYAEAGVVFIAPATRHPALTEPRAGATIFRLAGRDDRQGASAADYLTRTFPNKPLIVVADSSRVAQALVRDALATFKAAQHGEVSTVAIEGGQKDYAQLIAKLKESQAPAVFFAAFPIEGGLLLKQMRSAGLDTVFLGSDAIANAQLAEAAGSDANGARALLPHDAASAVPEATRRERFLLQAANGPFVSAYAAVEAWRAAAARAPTLAPVAVGAALQGGTFATVMGPIAFDEAGDARIPSYDLVTWKDGAWRPLE
jgi:branched-chain amino acid transport system substrate-binding protein